MKVLFPLLLATLGTIAVSTTAAAQTAPNEQGDKSASKATSATGASDKVPQHATVTGKTSKKTDAAKARTDARAPQTYQGAAGKTDNTSTACSTARTKANGRLDCGTGGEGATPGKVPK
jgi:hypothetical protein